MRRSSSQIKTGGRTGSENIMEKQELITLAKQVGTGIKETDLFQKYKEAEKVYLADGELQSKIAEYTVQQQALADEQGQKVPNQFLVEQVQKRINELYADIMHSESFEVFMQAQDNLRSLMDDVNRAIMNEVNGKSDAGESGCTGNCSTCGGCH